MSHRDRLRLRRSSDAALLDAPERDGNAVSLRIRERGDTPTQKHRTRRGRSLLQPLPLIGALLVAIALLGYLALYAQTGRRTAILVATRTLPPGATVRVGDFRAGRIASDAVTLAGLVPASQLQIAVGRTLQSGVAAGSPLARAALGRTAVTPASFTLVLPVLHAFGGDLRPGDRVTVLATYDQGGPGTAQAKAIGRDLLVESVSQPPTGIDASTATIAVTIALPDPSLASTLALANSDAKLDLLRDGSRPNTAPIPNVRIGTAG